MTHDINQPNLLRSIFMFALIANFYGFFDCFRHLNKQGLSKANFFGTVLGFSMFRRLFCEVNVKHVVLGLVFAVSPMVFALPPSGAPYAGAGYSTSAAPAAYVTPAPQDGVVTRGGDDGKGKIVATFGVAGVYTRQFTQDASTGQFGVDGKTHQLSGWSVTPEVNITKHLGFQADFINMYDMTPPDGINNIYKLSMLAGPRYTFNPYWKGVPFVFAEAGETRTSFGTTYYGYNPHPGVSWTPTANAGVGFDIKATRNIAIQLVPAEWMGERHDWNGKWQHNYQARLGFVFYLRK